MLLARTISGGPTSSRALRHSHPRPCSLSQESSLTEKQAKFYVGDRVWFDPGGSRPREGPYLVANRKENGRYALSYEDEDSTPVPSADDVDESQLSFVH